MRILSIDAEQRLLSLVTAVGRNPMSWQGWMCLYIDVVASDNSCGAPSCMLWVQSILGTYLKDVEGRVYVCDERYIHIICQDVDWSVMAEAAAQISSLIKDEDGLDIDYYIYDLGREGVLYADRVLYQDDGISWGSSDQVVAFQKSREAIRMKPFANIDLVSDDEISCAKPRVLLVDDDQVTRWMVANTLKHECEMNTAQTASQAFALYASLAPDLVFLDIDLPDKSGLNVLSWILKNDPGANVVMFSSNDSLDNIADTLEQGAHGFVAKPFLKRDLLYYVQGCAVNTSVRSA